MKNLLLLSILLATFNVHAQQLDYDKLNKQADSAFWADYNGPDPLAFDAETQEIFDLIESPGHLDQLYPQLHLPQPMHIPLRMESNMDDQQGLFIDIDWTPVVVLGVLIFGAGVLIGAGVF